MKEKDIFFTIKNADVFLFNALINLGFILWFFGVSVIINIIIENKTCNILGYMCKYSHWFGSTDLFMKVCFESSLFSLISSISIRSEFLLINSISIKKNKPKMPCGNN